MKIFLFLLSFLLLLNTHAQETKEVNPNLLHFYGIDTLYFSMGNMQSKRIKQIKEYTLNTHYADTALLMNMYAFNDQGALNKVKRYDVHGKLYTDTVYQINEANTISIESDELEVDISDTHSREKIEYRIKGNRDSVITINTFDNSGKKIAVETHTYNKKGHLIHTHRLLKKALTGAKRKRVKNSFCGYMGPPKNRSISYKYNEAGQCVEIEASSGGKKYEQVLYTYNDQQILLNKRIYRYKELSSEWSYETYYYE